jgi:hypothetical protein
MTLYRASITAAVVFGGLAIAVSSATAQKRYDPGVSDIQTCPGAGRSLWHAAARN